MRIRNKIQAVTSLFRVRFMRKRVPLAVRWQLTNRCVLKCQYCNIWDTPQSEMSLPEIVSILDEMADMGTQTISFSGGEPMLRFDIGEILRETSRRGISTEMNSTGAGIPARIKELEHLDFLKISLDGSEAVHDMNRGRNSYRMAIAAAEAARANGLNFIFATTLTKYNIKEIGFLLAKAEEYNTLVAFQPLKTLYRGVQDISAIAPAEADYRSAVQTLIRIKKQGNPHLRNSLIGLKHIFHWPHYPGLECWAGRVFCILNTDGTLVACDRIGYKGELPNCKVDGFRKAFAKLPPVRCGGCGFCGVLELNFLMSFRLGTMESIYKITK